jgi:hypothetical protein
MQRNTLLHRFLVAVLGANLVLAGGVTASAQESMTSYTDVQAGAWYESAAATLLDSGALDRSETRLRPNDLATRAEVMKMLVLVYGEDLQNPGTGSFSDVSKTAWYYPYVETAARAGWLHGDGNCYGTGTRPCNARPADRVNRAEMATLLQRAFALTPTGAAPNFPDNAGGMWYTAAIQAAADHCVLQGDDATGNVRPGAFMNRAEMIVMFYRASQTMNYGDDCGAVTQTPNLDAVSAVAANKIRLTFNVDLSRSWADDTARYDVQSTTTTDDALAVTNAAIVDDNVIELTLNQSMKANTQYRVSVQNMRTAGGRIFGDTANVTYNVSVSPDIVETTLVAGNRVRLRFNTDLEPTRADDASRYVVARSSGGGTVGVNRVTIVDKRTVELELGSTLSNQTAYTITASNLRTSDNMDFNDSTSLVTGGGTTVTMSGATALSDSRVRVHFSQPLDEATAETVSRYTVSGTNGNVSVWFATLVDPQTVELVLSSPLENQRSYTLSTLGLRTTGGMEFGGTTTFVYSPNGINFRASLDSFQETPPLTSSATGTGTFVLTSAGLQYDITLRNLSGSMITMSHFHNGAPGVSGPVIEPITFVGNRATGTWTDMTSDERNLLLNGNIYVNVHTPAYPNGEIRGQVVRQP